MFSTLVIDFYRQRRQKYRIAHLPNDVPNFSTIFNIEDLDSYFICAAYHSCTSWCGLLLTQRNVIRLCCQNFIGVPDFSIFFTVFRTELPEEDVVWKKYILRYRNDEPIATVSLNKGINKVMCNIVYDNRTGK